MKQSRIFIGLLTLFLGQTTFMCIHAKTLTTRETTALNLEQVNLQKEINDAEKETQKGKVSNLDKTQQVMRDVELAKKIKQYHLNKAKLSGRS